MTRLPAVAQLHRAIAISEEIQKLEAELASILGSTGGGGEIPTPFSIPVPTDATPKTRGRKKGQKLSAETRAKMKAAQQARHGKTITVEPAIERDNDGSIGWTKAKRGGTLMKKSVGKRTLSPEALERIREGQKKRWAKLKKGKQSVNHREPESPSLLPLK